MRTCGVPNGQLILLFVAGDDLGVGVKSGRDVFVREPPENGVNEEGGLPSGPVTDEHHFEAISGRHRSKSIMRLEKI